MPGPLEGELALVTGAGKGMGRAIARRLAVDGARVAVNDRVHDERVDAVVAETGGLAAACDVSDPEAVAATVEELERAAGPVGILVANHALMDMGPFVEQDEAGFWAQVDTNLSGTLELVGRCSRACGAAAAGGSSSRRRSGARSAGPTPSPMPRPRRG